MKKNIFAVCDLEADYAEKFADYLISRRQIPFEVHAFTSCEALTAFAREHPIELLLVGTRALTREIRLLDVGKLVVLSEGEEPSGDYNSVYKYQSTSKILQETMAAYGEESSGRSLLPVFRKTVKVYGVYSPLGRCGKTLFALTLGQELARTSPTLYVSLEGWSGLSGLLKKDFPRSFSDILYYARLREEGLIHRINSTIQATGHLDLIPPVNLADDIRQAGKEDLEYIMNEIISYSNYESMILDIGNDFPDPLPVMDWCTTGFIPVLNDIVSAYKLEQFEKTMSDSGWSRLYDKWRRISLPHPSIDTGSGNLPEKLLWSETGDYVRSILNRE